jgi:hypothetical protein
MQMDAMHEFATRRGWTVIDTVEEVASGAKDNRPKRQALLKAAKQRKLDVILVWKLDRWGRSLVDLMTTLQERTTLGVGFVSLTEALDLTIPAGRAFAGFLAVFAEFERQHYTVDRLASRLERLGYRVPLEPVATTAACVIFTVTLRRVPSLQARGGRCAALATRSVQSSRGHCGSVPGAG